MHSALNGRKIVDTLSRAGAHVCDSVAWPRRRRACWDLSFFDLPWRCSSVLSIFTMGPEPLRIAGSRFAAKRRLLRTNSGCRNRRYNYLDSAIENLLRIFLLPVALCFLSAICFLVKKAAATGGDSAMGNSNSTAVDTVMVTLAVAGAAAVAGQALGTVNRLQERAAAAAHAQAEQHTQLQQPFLQLPIIPPGRGRVQIVYPQQTNINSSGHDHLPAAAAAAVCTCTCAAASAAAAGCRCSSNVCNNSSSASAEYVYCGYPVHNPYSNKSEPCGQRLKNNKKNLQK